LASGRIKGAAFSEFLRWYASRQGMERLRAHARALSVGNEWNLDLVPPSLEIDPLSSFSGTSGNTSMSVTNQRLAYIDFNSPREKGFNTYGYASIELSIRFFWKSKVRASSSAVSIHLSSIRAV